MPKEKKPKPEMLGTGMAASAGKALRGRAEQIRAAEEAAMGKPQKKKRSAPTSSWGRGVKRNK
jgi:hypothetical protein